MRSAWAVVSSMKLLKLAMKGTAWKARPEVHLGQGVEGVRVVDEGDPHGAAGHRSGQLPGGA